LVDEFLMVLMRLRLGELWDENNSYSSTYTNKSFEGAMRLVVRISLALIL
jgi:hypothetical protein